MSSGAFKVFLWLQQSHKLIREEANHPARDDCRVSYGGSICPYAHQMKWVWNRIHFGHCRRQVLLLEHVLASGTSKRWAKSSFGFKAQSDQFRTLKRAYCHVAIFRLILIRNWWVDWNFHHCSFYLLVDLPTWQNARWIKRLGLKCRNSDKIPP